MAWTNLGLTIGDFTGGELLYADSPTYTGYSSNTPLFNLGTNLDDLPITQNEQYTLFDNGIFKMTVIHASDPANKDYAIRAFYYDTAILTSGTWGWWKDTFHGIGFGYDEELQQGSIFFCSVGEYGDYSVTQYTYDASGRYNAYLAIIGSLQPAYTWSSVPAISGKNGILSLPTLIDTDGEPISGQSASVFSSLPEGSNVRALINGAL